MTTECPYLPLTERDISGELSLDEMEGLNDHLASGCTVCEGRIEDHLEGSGDDVAAAGIRALNELLSNAAGVAGDTMEQGRVLVLDRIQRKIMEEDRAQRRRVRRRMQRILFYVVNVAAVFMIITAYVLNVTTIKVLKVNAQKMATRAEVGALSRALHLYVIEHRELPGDTGGLIAALQRTRADDQPFYPFSRARLRQGGYEDDFGRPYRYLVRRNQALIYSVGPNGIDEEGEGDDVKDDRGGKSGWVIFSR